MRFTSASRRQNSASSFLFFGFIVSSEEVQDDVCSSDAVPSMTT